MKCTLKEKINPNLQKGIQIQLRNENCPVGPSVVKEREIVVSLQSQKEGKVRLENGGFRITEGMKTSE